MTPDKILPVILLTITELCYISLFDVSLILFRRTNHKGFVITSAAFGCWIVERLVLLFASTGLLVSYGNYIGHIYTLGLMLLAVGFLSLLRRFPSILNPRQGHHPNFGLRFLVLQGRPV